MVVSTAHRTALPRGHTTPRRARQPPQFRADFLLSSVRAPRQWTYAREMASRVAGVFALVGGVAWLLKFVLIWENGGTNTTDGLVGVLFVIGAVGILLGAGIRAWFAPGQGVLRYRLLLLLVVVAALAVAVNLPILLGWVLFGRTWLAEEVGVLLTAIGALVLGARWAVVGTRPASAAETRPSHSS